MRGREQALAAARARGHVLDYGNDGRSDRATCERCGRAVLYPYGHGYGSALEQGCTATAWELIGYGEQQGEGHVRVVGGRTLYELVSYRDDTRGEKVKLSRLSTRGGLHAVERYVDPDALLEVVVGR